jgi:two-component system response regulator YesN
MNLCRKINFDMVVSDFELGEISGVELINKIRKKCPRIKAILMSGSFDFDRKMLERGEVDAFLQKPFEVKELESLIKRILDG